MDAWLTILVGLLLLGIGACLYLQGRRDGYVCGLRDGERFVLDGWRRETDYH